MISLLLQIGIKPLHRLIESLLLAKFDVLLLHVAPDRETVLHAAVQIDLVRLADFLQDRF